jgi:hypothetical protein
MAQVTLTGGVAYGYSVGDTYSGLGTDDAYLKFSTTEDLGGGLKLSASLGIDGIIETASGTTSALANGNNITISGGFGTVSMTTGVGGDAVALDQLMTLGNGTVGSTVGYVAPAFGPVTLSYTRKDGSAVLGEGSGGGGNSIDILGASYAAGAIKAGVTSLTWPDSANTGGIDSRLVLTASYDLGVAKVGVYSNTQKYVSSATQDLKNTALQISAPVGPVAVSFESGKVSQSGETDLNGTSLSISYALSKRTAVTAKTEKVDTSATATSKGSSLILSHSF